MSQTPKSIDNALPPSVRLQQIRRQRARALARRLATLARNFPEYQHLLEDPLLLLLHQSNRALVLHAIHTGAWTIEQLKSETKLPRLEIQTMLDALVHSKIIFTRTLKEENPSGGRPKILYLPAPNSDP